MDFFDIIDKLEAYATSKGYYPIIGTADYRNALADSNTYADSEKIFMIDFPGGFPVLVNNRLMSHTYSGVILLGQKREDTTRATLDETIKQKLDRRIKTLAQTMIVDIATFACNENIEVVFNQPILMQPNSFDLNADFVVGDVTFTVSE